MMLTSTQIGELAAQFFIAGVGTLCFAILFACPRKSLFFCGLVGAVGWFVYYTAYYFIQGNNALALSHGISTFKVAVALAIGITLVLSVPIPKKRRN